MSGDFANYSEIWDTAISDAFLVIFIFDVSKFVGLDAHGPHAADYRQLVLEASRFAGKRTGHPDTTVVLAIGWCDKLEIGARRMAVLSSSIWVAIQQNLPRSRTAWR